MNTRAASHFIYTLPALAILAFPAPSSGIDLIETFEGTELDTAVWQPTSDKPPTVDAGRLTWSDAGGNWASGDISTVQQFFLPPEGQTTVIEWTLAPATVTVDAGQSLRMQIGIHSVNEPALRREHWPNTTGGVWLDLDNMNPINPGLASGAYRSANDTKVSDSQATQVATESSSWNWLAENRVYRMEITNTGYKWFDKSDSEEIPAAEQEWEAAGIDTEFDNGFRVLALGMNYNTGRGTTSVDQIAITNAFGPSSLITAFGATRLSPFSGQPINLTWAVDPAASVSLDQGIGNVDNQTTDGVGSTGIVPPPSDVPTQISYTLTATKGAVTSTRVLTLNVQVTPPLTFEDFSDEFDTDQLNTEEWIHRGDKTYAVGENRLNWAADGSNWGHGEINSLKVFPVPPAGSVTTIKWALGKASVTVNTAGANALRPMIGITSAFETNTWSRQHWQNTTGGVWLDITTMGSGRTDGVSGTTHAANDTKVQDTNASQISSFNISDWNWETDSHVITLELTDQGFTWLNGQTPLGSGTWADAGIDTEFSKGFRLHAMAGNSDIGRGEMSLDAVSLLNSVPFDFVIDDLLFDPALDTVTVTFGSMTGVNYALDASADLKSWTKVSETTATGSITSLMHDAATGPESNYRIRNLMLKPLP